MNKTISILKFLIGWPLAVVAIIFLVKLFLPQFSSIQSRINNVNVFLFVSSIILFLIFHFLRSFVWKKIMEYKGHKIPLMENAYLWEVSEFKRYIPGNVWSFLSRITLFGDRGIDKKAIGVALVDEIQLIVISESIISLFSLPFILSSGSAQLLNTMKVILFASIAGLFIFSVALAIIYKKRGHKNFVANLFLPGYTFRQKFILLIIYTIDFAIFGIANLLVCLSIFSFDPKLYLELSAFFTFALLVGFLSFVTPTGLGVREGVITLGLSSITSVSIAGFLSIFSRIILIISEAIFLLIVLVFEISAKIKNR
jgi:glycosyltransferase 2 family protein